MAIPLRPPVYPLESNEFDEKARGTFEANPFDNVAMGDKVEAMHPRFRLSRRTAWLLGAVVVAIVGTTVWRRR